MAWGRIQRCDGGLHRGVDVPEGVNWHDSKEPVSKLSQLTGPVLLDELPEHIKQHVLAHDAV